MSELKNCPFCGPVEILHQWAGNVEIRHKAGCFLESITTLYGAAHIAKWNRRAESAALTAITDAHCARCECAQTPCECAAKMRELETALTAACERNGNLSVELAAAKAEREEYHQRNVDICQLTKDALVLSNSEKAGLRRENAAMRLALRELRLHPWKVCGELDGIEKKGITL